MNQTEEEYIEDFLKKIKKNFKDEKKKISQEKKSIRQDSAYLISLEERYNQQSQYVNDLKSTVGEVPLMDKLREDNMLLYQTNIDLRLFIKEL